MITKEEFNEFVLEANESNKQGNENFELIHKEMDLITQAINNCTREIATTIRIRLNELEERLKKLENKDKKSSNKECIFTQEKKLEILRKNNIDDLNFPVITKRCLKAAKIEQISDLVNLTREDLLKIKYFGNKSLWIVKNILNSIGLSLKS